MDPVEIPREPQPPRLFALRAARVPFFTPLMFGFVAALSAIEPGWFPRPLPAWALSLIGVAAALAATAISSALLQRGIPDGLRLTDTAMELLRGHRIVQRVDLTRLREVSEFEVQTGKVLLVADKRRHIALPSYALAEERQYADVTHRLVEAMERLDPTGTVSRGAVKTGKLREVIAQQPVRGAFALGSILILGAMVAFRNRDVLAGSPYVDEALGALNLPLVIGGEQYRLLSYLFVHSSPLHFLVCLVGVVYVGSYLEKLVGWERMLFAFVAGVLGGAVMHLTLSGLVPAMGAGGGLFGLFGLMGAIALLKRRLPPTIVPPASFWIMTVLLALMLPATADWAAPFQPVGIPESFGDLFLRLTHLPTVASVDFGGAVGGFFTGLFLVRGLEVPATEAARKDLRAFGVLACAALAIGLFGSASMARKYRDADADVVTASLLSLRGGADAALVQNAFAYTALIDPQSKTETVDIAARLAQAAVENTGHSSPEELDTLAVARYRQEQVSEAKALLTHAMTLTTDPDLLKALRRHADDMDKGRPIEPDPETELSR